MNPDLDLRLQSMIKALSDAILPAIPPHERMARAQVGLLIGHINIILEHWQHGLNYELATCAAACELARELAALDADLALAAEIHALLACIEGMDRSSYEVVSRLHRELNLLIDRAIAADHVRSPMSAEMMAAVLRYNDRRAPRERIWHRASGLDPDLATLPPISSLFDTSAAPD